jgi:hypothetical protein
MPLQNRVDPWGNIIRTTARGTFMGNRGGALHNAEREIVRRFKSRRWITCVLEFKGRKRSVMTPGLYTELFFLDEAVAFAAGHRPCAECRRARFNAFRDAWQRPEKNDDRSPLLADEIDLDLHRARIDRHGKKITWQAKLSSLPDGCFVEIDGSGYLVSDKTLLQWSPECYTRRETMPGNLIVKVLTPRPIVRCFRRGYQPEMHSSTFAL